MRRALNRQKSKKKQAEVIIETSSKSSKTPEQKSQELAATAEQQAQNMRLVQLSKDLDTTLNFLTSRKYGFKKCSELAYFPMSTVESSLKNLNGKALPLVKFQQLLWLVPSHYKYRVVNGEVQIAIQNHQKEGESMKVTRELTNLRETRVKQRIEDVGGKVGTARLEADGNQVRGL